MIAKKADGALRDAQSLFDQVISFGGSKIEASELSTMLNLIDEEIYFKISDSILSKKYAAAFDVTREVYEKGWNFLDFTNGLIEHFRNIMTVVIKKNSDLIDSAEVYKKMYLNYVGSFSEGDLLRILTFLNTVQYELKSSPNEKLKIEISLAHLIGLEKSGTISQLLNSIENLDITKFEGLVNQVTPPQNYSAEKKKIESKVEKSIAQDSDPEIEEIKKVNETIPKEITLDFVKLHWSELIERVNSEKFSVGSHLLNSIPLQLENNCLKVQLDHHEDIEIIKSDYKNIDCLKSIFKQMFAKSTEFSFESKTSNLRESISDSSINNSDEDSPLIKAIKNDLGGKEINSH